MLWSLLLILVLQALLLYVPTVNGVALDGPALLAALLFSVGSLVVLEVVKAALRRSS